MENTNDKSLIKLVTHNGSFHADDIFATAALSILFERKGQPFEVTRSRDMEVIQKADYVYDVGGIYDEATNRFDHHQKGGAGRNEYNIEYSSFGLVWKKFGEEICESKEVAEIINKKLVSPVDAHDNGMDLVDNKYEVAPYNIQYFFYSMVPTWREEEEGISFDENFMQSVNIAKKILLREIVQAKDLVFAENSIKKIYEDTKDKRVLVFDKNYPSAEILHTFPETLFVIYPRIDSSWGVKAVRSDIRTFKNRKDFPEAWGALVNEELQKVTGVNDAVFCHRALFLAVAKSKEGALKLAELALTS